MPISLRTDRKRGCGWRKPGGLYLVADGPSMPCGLLPLPLTRCPTCDCGIKPTRGWTWVDAGALFVVALARGCGAPPDHCALCPARRLEGRHGLLWIGESFYKTPQEWTRESEVQGISRRLSTVPKGFVVGETWVLVAHRKAIALDDGTSFQAGVFQMFRPQAVEYVVKGTENEEEIAALEKRGITPVRVERKESAPLLEEATA